MTHLAAALLGYLLGIYSLAVLRLLQGLVWRRNGARPGDPSAEPEVLFV